MSGGVYGIFFFISAILLLGKVRKRLTMNVDAIKLILENSCSHLSFNPWSFDLLESSLVTRRRVDFGKMKSIKMRNTSSLLHDVFSFDQSVYAVIVVYDITQRRSFEEAKELVHRLALWAPLRTPLRACPFVFAALVGNKADLENRREVSFKVSNVTMFM